MFTGTIYFSKEHKMEIEDIFGIIIPNDYRVFVNDWKIYKPVWMEHYICEVTLDDSKEWGKLKRLYFDGKYNKPALPKSIVIR